MNNVTERAFINPGMPRDSQVSSRTNAPSKKDRLGFSSDQKSLNSADEFKSLLSDKFQEKPLALKNEKPKAETENEFFPAIDRKEEFQSPNPIVEKWLDDMETVAGVEREDLVQTIVSLPKEELQQKPELVLPKILEKMGLEPEQFEVAETLSEELAMGLNLQSQVIEFQKVSSSAKENNQRNIGIEKLNKSFFELPNSALVQAHIAQGPTTINGKINQTELKTSNDLKQVGSIDGKFLKNTEARFSNPLIPKIAEQVSATSGNSAQELVGDLSASDQTVQSLAQISESDDIQIESYKPLPSQAAPDLSEQLVRMDRFQNPTVPTLKTNSVLSGELVSELPSLVPGSKSQISTSTMTQMANATVSKPLEMASSKNFESEDDLDSDQQEFLAGQGVTSANLSEDKKVGTAATEKAFVLPSAEDQKINLENLSRQTRLAAEKGGGEMKLKLRPEGLGEIDIKVKVEDGKVHVQMMADSNEAKNLLEKGLGDLKSSLELHKFKVDTMKVDVSDQTRFASQQDAQSDLGRQMAHQFLGNFRDQNEGFRQSFMDIPQLRNYKATGQKSASTLEETAAIRSRSRSHDRRLDLVA